MSKVLLTGGSGFIAAHVLNVLLERGHSVVTTVRSAAKGEKILEAVGTSAKGKLSYVVVSDIAQEGAFDKAVQAEPPFDYVIHTASPFPDAFNDAVKDVLDPAIKGTTGILKAIKAHAPSVKRVVVTSSFAAIMRTKDVPKVYSEADWNPITWEEATTVKAMAYRGSKKFAEKAAWDFVANEKPNFDLSTICPPLVFGPVEHHLASLDRLNTSNLLIRDIIQGKHVNSDVIPPRGGPIFTDVRDLALAHVRAIEVPEAGGKRFFVVSDYYSGKRIVDAVRATHPELEDKLPKDLKEDLPADIFGFDNSRTQTVLGIKFRTLKESVNDTVTSLVELGA
ncbi:ketoreductase [Niveomyces insectorum RCEF 264]|uniref:Ketoreductase n=1 Tax=Niveomyces insectorum RCEF 264 TaxID=1081102 RepID=A0A167Z0Z1_9HYPO|nr:ketoreductase [Niveomyces insectorum RCEF 264]